MTAPALSAQQSAAVAARLASAKGYTAWHAGVRRDPLMRLFTEAGRRDRYRIYERLRAEGPIVRSSTGLLSVVSHPVADGVLYEIRLAMSMGKPLRFLSAGPTIDDIRPLDIGDIEFEPELGDRDGIADAIDRYAGLRRGAP